MVHLSSQRQKAIRYVNQATLYSFSKAAGLTLVAALLIGSTVAISEGAPLTLSLFRAALIGACNLFFVAALAWPVARWRRRPGHQAHFLSGWPYTIFAIVVGTGVGFFCGDLLGSWVLGSSTPTLLQRTVAENPALLYVVWLPCLAVILGLAALQAIAARDSAANAARRLATVAQLRLVESQLNPHMLFNCLASLDELMESDQRQAHFMFDRLIGFLRANLNGSRRPEHPLKDEFDRLSDFLQLMQIRIGDRLSFRLVLPAALSDDKMPSLLLQPLVENAIKHGIEPSVAGGYVHVSARREGMHLVLRVRDSGVGLNGRTSAANGFGLHHVRERLDVLYGRRASFELKSPKDSAIGAIAVVRLPLEQHP